jgi:superfamily II DNA or RNA helicase
VVSAVTGAGKSILIAELCRLALARTPDRVVLVTTPTRALVRQLSATIEERIGRGRVGRYFTSAKDATSPVIVTCNPSTLALSAELLALRRRAGLVIVDECHGSESETLRASIPLLSPRWRVGFTATPFRSLPKESLTLWSRVVYRYTLDDALRDGVLVPFRSQGWDGRGTDEIDEVCLALLQAHARGPGIISALTIEDAEQYAAYLTAKGLAAKAIHSKLSAPVQAALLADLEAGKLSALVHVSLLSEGVDLPWLRWLCMRRPVQARVRFVQELGRVLRVHPGKTEALLLDPHDLLGLHGIAHPETLGMILEEQAEQEERGPQEDIDRGRVMPPAVAVGELLRWARGLVLAFQAAGIVKPLAARSWSWRTEDASAKQTAHLLRMAWTLRHVPEPHAEIARVAFRCPMKLKRGGTGDLLRVLHAVADLATRSRVSGQPIRWPALDVPIPSPAAIQAL